MNYLTLEDVLEIHKEVIKRTGSSEGVRDISLLDSAVARPGAIFGGIDLYLLISEKAAALLHSLICNHPFVDGNKRTGFTAVDVFIRLNGRHLTATEDEKYSFIQGIASGTIAFSEIAGWIEQRLT